MSSAVPKPMPTAEQLFEQALLLPKDQRLRLADQLWESIESERGDDPLDLDPELRAELVRRLKKIEDGSAVLLDGDEVSALRLTASRS